MSYHAKLIKGGKIVIPAALRREYGLKEGDTIVLRSEGEKITVQSDEALMRELRARLKAGLKRPLTLDSYLKEKWAEADKE
jgi:AbrB family transcriptional regulator, stage V sporulation protein T